MRWGWLSVEPRLINESSRGANFSPRKIPGRIFNILMWRPLKAKTFAFNPRTSIAQKVIHKVTLDSHDNHLL